MSNAPQPSLATRLRAGETIVTAWSNLAVPILAEVMGRAGYPCVTLDMQHGMHDIASLRDGLAAIALSGAHRAVRIPVGESGTASRALDFGAELVIAPMINSAAEARAFADAMKYPPVGARSWGPQRGAMLAGKSPADYLASANTELLSLAMIETPEAIAALDDILAEPGIDGIFVGPSDLSLTLNKGARLDPGGPLTMAAAQDIAARTRAAGKIAGIFCLEASGVAQARDMGYSFIAHGVDLTLFSAALKDTLARIG
ncbi:hydroxyacid aldolase [Microvirga tunisiensis]|uniref:Hydroxyacid aldolase n=2 Tax=Pannonibacter tanglangensis TaxID=2750084 RepID=A0ABW9ZFX1_9HYPH|nr:MULTISPECIES: aldolase/citrate lyase family protein [unclassified Pannonibacter]NBN63588.1 hydroxyacid aldolase [Pannonibacter sp. XCT-34]NBN77225.1 hydroxyacid aldolase [Pannonibacter sp. XCT-53]